jgi:2-deoxy-D-gluconate 3-dehydrogenase
MALALSKAGADIILVQRNTTNTTTKDTIEQSGGKADIVVCDLASKEDVAKLIPHVTGELKRTLDIVVNCGMYSFLEVEERLMKRWYSTTTSCRELP